MRNRRSRVLLPTVLVAVLALFAAPSAQAVHLFPLTPVFDPLGHDCAQVLEADAGTSEGQVAVIGFDFIDSESNSSTTTISAGESVTWTWLADHCHSVTFGDGSGTEGQAGFDPAQPELVRVGEDLGADSFTMTFDEPGEYFYFCVHHAIVGMTGSIIVE